MRFCKLQKLMLNMVAGEGFEPSKAELGDLQSPFHAQQIGLFLPSWNWTSLVSIRFCFVFRDPGAKGLVPRVGFVASDEYQYSRFPNPAAPVPLFKVPLEQLVILSNRYEKSLESPNWSDVEIAGFTYGVLSTILQVLAPGAVSSIRRR